MTNILFSGIKAGNLAWPNRIVMAPMTRGRATRDGVPTPKMAEYYRLRADAGLIVTEATAISPQAYGWLDAPGIFNDVQQQAWKPVTDAVHKDGGRIYLQLWHMGRVSHPDFLNGALPVGPSAVAAKGETHTAQGKKAYVTPHALTVDEIKSIVQDYAKATKRALDAGFDGVEIHAANGYLIDQFLRDSSNKRTDNYGGSVENRVRLLREVTQAVIQVAGADKVGVRLSPKNPYNDMSDSNPAEIFGQAAVTLNALGIAYLHVMEALPGHFMAGDGQPVLPVIRKAFKGVLITNGGYDKGKAEAALAKGEADAVAFGLPFLANPDLVERYRTNAPLNAPDQATLYTLGEKGYLDYPLLSTKAA